MQWRGGILYEAYKPSGAHDQFENFRSLFVSSFLGKAFDKTLRSKLGAETFPALFILTHLRRLRSSKLDGAILFIDTKSAYYRIVATGCIETDQVIEFFVPSGWTRRI